MAALEGPLPHLTGRGFLANVLVHLELIMLTPLLRRATPLLVGAALCAVSPGVANAQDTYVGTGDTINMGGGSPDYYTVQPGDTLWEISSKFLGNAYYWPRLWSINDYITNPHWIYPGNRVVFRMGTLIDPRD